MNISVSDRMNVNILPNALFAKAFYFPHLTDRFICYFGVIFDWHQCSRSGTHEVIVISSPIYVSHKN